MTQPNTVIEPGKHHVSKTYIPLFIFRGIWMVILIAIIGVLNVLGEAENIIRYINLSQIFLFIILGVIVVLGVIALIGTLGYKRLTWEITDEELHVYKGILIKKKSHIPFRRIHSVDINAKVLDRIFGVVTVKLDTAAGSASSEDAKIPALNLSTAEAIRSEIFRRKNASEMTTAASSSSAAQTIGGGNLMDDIRNENENLRGIFAGDPGADQTPDAEYKLTNKELILYCIANGKALVFVLIAVGFVSQAYGIMHNFSSRTSEFADEVTEIIISSGPAIIALIGLGILVASLVISFITRALTYGNFAVRRYSGRIEVSTGLIQRKSTGVAVERIQTLKIKQGLLQRILGYAEISLETASGMGKSGGNDQEQNPGVIIHPFIKKNMIEDYMTKMLREFNDKPDDLKGLTKTAARRSVVRYAIWTFLLVILPVNLGWYFIREFAFNDNEMTKWIPLIDDYMLWFSIAFFALLLAIGWGAWKGRAYARNDKYIALRRGVLGRTKTYVPKKKIQYAVVAQNPFQKRVRLTTLKANTAALGSSYQSIKDIGLDISNDYLGWIEHKHSV